MIQQDISKTRLVLAALPALAQGGWVPLSLEKAEQMAGIAPGTYRATFPEGMADFTRAFHAWVDDGMRAAIAAQKNFASLKVREKIFAVVMARFNLLQPHREAVRRLAAQHMLPWNGVEAAKNLAHAADAMWKLAGDQSIDYNFYTKRLLLSGVYATTLPVWLNDDSASQQKTQTFLKSRIENVLQIGKAMSGLKARFKKAA